MSRTGNRERQLNLSDGDKLKLWSRGVRGDGGCLLWQGARDHQGYGLVHFRRRMYRAHRIAFVVANGEIPTGQIVCHHCDRPPCIEPSHLFAGTYRDNTHDAVGKKRMAVGLRNGAHTKPEARRAGSLNGRALLNENDVRAIRMRFATSNISRVTLAVEYGVNESTITKVILKALWRHVV